LTVEDVNDAEADGEGRCTSLNRYGVRCRGSRGHGALHSSEAEGVLYVWSDESSPTLAIELFRPKDG
jgi:hypothetical protein